MQLSWLGRHCIGKCSNIPKASKLRLIASSDNHLTASCSSRVVTHPLTCPCLPRPHPPWQTAPSDKTSSARSISHSAPLCAGDVDHDFRLTLEDERRTLEEMLKLAITHIDGMTSVDLAAMWSRLPRGLPKHHRKYKKPQREME